MASTYNPAGYQNALQFDAGSGIIKYGRYEFFANQVVAPKKSTLTFDSYVESKAPRQSILSQFAGQLYRPTEAQTQQMRVDFAKDVQSGAFTGYAKTPPTSSGQNGGNVGMFDFKELSGRNDPSFREVIQVDANTFEVNNYKIPGDIDFINKLSEKAVNINTNAELGQTTDGQRPSGGSSRLGKPNYSRAATILSGETSPLGGAAASLGGAKSSLGA